MPQDELVLQTSLPAGEFSRWGEEAATSIIGKTFSAKVEDRIIGEGKVLDAKVEDEGRFLLLTIHWPVVEEE